jgi:type I restriction enzyme M protein
MNTVIFQKNIKELIDNLKNVCANYGLGNDGNEFKIITQVFLYKFLNDKFIYEIKKIDKKLNNNKNIIDELKKYKKNDYELLLLQLNEGTARIKPDQLIANLFKRQNESNFAEIFDNNLLNIAKENSSIFSVITDGGEKIPLFENISKYVTDKRDDFCKAIINKLINFSFEDIFNEKFDFFATIFEYLIKDYNSNSGGKYAEYFTPHAIAKIMSLCLVNKDASNVTCYDPSAGSGTLLMNLAHAIGENKCSIYSQDISQKSSLLLRLNLILNNLVHSIPNIIQGNTILEPYHKDSKNKLKQFDFIISNPPFKLDFSDYRNDLERKENNERFFAGIPKIKKKKKDKMEIYLLFIQHIIFSLSEKGKAAIVVPTGFISAKGGIEKKIRQHLIKNKLLKGIVSMPSDIFATTGTNVSILFIDSQIKNNKAILIDASNLGTIIKEGKNQKTLLSNVDEQLIIDSFNNLKVIENFSTVVDYALIEKKNYSFSARQYFEIKIKYTELSEEDFRLKINEFKNNINNFLLDSKNFQKKIETHLTLLNYED